MRYLFVLVALGGCTNFVAPTTQHRVCHLASSDTLRDTTASGVTVTIVKREDCVVE